MSALLFRLYLTVLLLLVLFCSSCFFSKAQNASLDIIYLKNGSILKGEILEILPNEKVVIKINDQVLEFRMEEVKRIRKSSFSYDSEEEEDLVSTSSERRRNIKNTKFEGYNFLAPTASIGGVSIERRGNEGRNPRNRGYQAGYEVGLHFLTMFSRSWGLGTGFRLANYTAQIPYYVDVAQELVRYRNQDLYYLNIPVFFKLLTGRPQSINLYIDLGLEPCVSFTALQPLVNQIEINRFMLNSLFGIGIRIPFNETVSATLGYRNFSSMTNSGWSDYVANFGLQYSAFQIALLLSPPNWKKVGE